MKNTLFTSKSGTNYLVPFIIITSCFALWGLAHDITNPMVKAFSKIFRMSVTDGSLVQVAFYGGYFAMAIPTAMFIRRFSYKSGILVGLALYAIGALLFIPAKETGLYYSFLFAYFIMTCGLSFLETSANPYILSMGDEETATRRLNLAQAFNPVGSLVGMFIAMNFIQTKLNPMSTQERALLDDSSFNALKESDLSVLIAPYITIGIVIAAIFFLLFFYKVPVEKKEGSVNLSNKGSVKKLLCNRNYREGVIAQFFYVGAQIMCWTFIIQYGTNIFMKEGMSETASEILSQKYNIVAMLLFCICRFVCTLLMKYFNPSRLLMNLAIVGALLVVGVILFENRIGLCCLVGVSACMSLMFPTIYGIALKGMSKGSEFGSAGLIMAILGGSILPPVQAMIIDMKEVAGYSAVNISFIVPLISFFVIAVYGRRTLSVLGVKAK